MSGLLHADSMVLCGESQEDMRMMMRNFVEVRERRDWKVNASKSKVMVLRGEEESMGSHLNTSRNLSVWCLY